jgi:hypothetical protein
MPKIRYEQLQHPVTFVVVKPPCKNLAIEKSSLSELCNKNLTSARHAELQLPQGQTVSLVHFVTENAAAVLLGFQ